MTARCSVLSTCSAKHMRVRCLAKEQQDTAVAGIIGITGDDALNRTHSSIVESTIKPTLSICMLITYSQPHNHQANCNECICGETATFLCLLQRRMRKVLRCWSQSRLSLPRQGPLLTSQSELSCTPVCEWLIIQQSMHWVGWLGPVPLAQHMAEMHEPNCMP